MHTSSFNSRQQCIKNLQGNVSIVKLLFDRLCAEIIEMNILETPCETLVVLIS